MTYPAAPGGVPINPAAASRWLGWAIFATVCMCTPLGVAGIVFAVLAQSAQKRGDWQAVEGNVRKARLFTLVAIGLGALFWGIGAVGAFLDSSSGTQS